MKLRWGVRAIISVILTLAMVTPMASCGTILYPERRQRDLRVIPEGRRIDPAVAVLDAVCLIFFIIPGVIAFAVDFSTGAIYFQNGTEKSSASIPDQKNRLVFHMISSETDQTTLERIISRKTGIRICFDDKKMLAFQIDHPIGADTISTELAKIDSVFNKQL